MLIRRSFHIIKAWSIWQSSCVKSFLWSLCTLRSSEEHIATAIPHVVAPTASALRDTRSIRASLSRSSLPPPISSSFVFRSETLIIASCSIKYRYTLPSVQPLVVLGVICLTDLDDDPNQPHPTTNPPNNKPPDSDSCSPSQQQPAARPPQPPPSSTATGSPRHGDDADGYDASDTSSCAPWTAPFSSSSSSRRRSTCPCPTRRRPAPRRTTGARTPRWASASRGWCSCG